MRIHRAVGILAAAACFTVLPAFGQWKANTKICVPSLAWFGGGPPAITADPTDPGWRGATVYKFNNTVGTPDVPVQMMAIQDATNLYLRFNITRNGATNAADKVVLMFDNGTGTERRRLIIVPTLGGLTSTAAPVAPSDIRYTKGTSFNGSGALGYTAVPAGTGTQFGSSPGGPPAGLVAMLTIASTGGVSPIVTTLLDVKIPYVGGADPFPLGVSPFGFYMDVIRILTDLSANSTTWPSDSPIGGFYTDTPAFSDFSTASLGGVCKGVNIDSSDISANNDPLSLDGPPTGTDNVFTVAVHNTTVDGSGAAVLAPRVQATFKLCDFGIPNPASGRCLIVGAGNPTAIQDIPPNTTSACPAAGSIPCFRTGGWHPLTTDPVDRNRDYFVAHPHQCLLVELAGFPPSTTGACSGATPPAECNSVLFVKNAALQNMNFPGGLNAGVRFMGNLAAIDAIGYEVPVGRNFQQFDLHVAAQPFAAIRGRGRDFTAAAAGTNQNNLLWTVHGYRHTGRFLNVDGKRYELVDHAGSFGYELQYKSDQAAKWRYQFFGERGARLDGGQNGIYSLRVPAGKVAYVNTAIEADDQAPNGGPQEPGEPDGGKMKWIWIILAVIVVLVILFLIFRRK